jgi:hypothetical protein
MADVRGLVDDVLPRRQADPSIVRTSGGEPVEALPPERVPKGVFDGAPVKAGSTPSPSDAVVVEESTGSKAIEAATTTPPAPDVTRFDDGTKRVTRRGVDTERGKADVTEAYDEQDRIVSTDATFADGHRVESRWSYPAEGHWSQVDTIRDPSGKTLGAITTIFDGERVTRTVEPIDGQPQTDIWDRDGPVSTMQNVVAPALAVPFLLDLAAAAIGGRDCRKGDRRHDRSPEHGRRSRRQCNGPSARQESGAGRQRPTGTGRGRQATAVRTSRAAILARAAS